jgi:hypothetical protein
MSPDVHNDYASQRTEIEFDAIFLQSIYQITLSFIHPRRRQYNRTQGERRANEQDLYQAL